MKVAVTAITSTALHFIREPYASCRVDRIQNSDSQGQTPFLDTLLIGKEDENVKLLAYRKKTHTDQYLHFVSHHPSHQKLGVIMTLFNRCDNVVTEEEDRRQEEEHITSALKQCSYPAWSIQTAKKDMQDNSDERLKKANQKKMRH